MNDHGDIPRKRIATYTVGPVRFLYGMTHAHHGPDNAGARPPEEVDSMTNTSIWRITHTCELGLPTATYGEGAISLGIAGRVASPRLRVVDGTVMPLSTGDVSLEADKTAVADVAVAAVTDAFAFPGPPAWSPPI